MLKNFSFFLLSLASISLNVEAITIEECVTKAQDNYPLIKQYGLIESTRDIELSDINKGWLPKIDIYAQATAQNVVPSFPEALAGKMGEGIRGLGKLQYKAGADISQTIWDGGASKAKRNLAKARELSQTASIDVEMYQIRQRVENLYFAVLLTQKQIEQSENNLAVVNANLGRLRSMLKNGTAMQSDVDMVEAQALTIGQSITQADIAAKTYCQVLSIFTGDEISADMLTVPSAEIPLGEESQRPELKYYESQQALNEASQKLYDASLMPKVGLFAQAYYGYPGFDYFKGMMTRDMTFNALAGVKISWNIDSFYTRKNNSRKTKINNESVVSQRETFLFNSNLQAASEVGKINGIKRVMKDDQRIVALRSNVRKAAETQLENGVIDATALLSKISDENAARLNAALHEIQLIQEIYALKNTLNK